MEDLTLPISLPLSIHWLLALALILRVMISRKTVESTFAWIFIIMLVPYIGAIIYLLIGELRLGAKRTARIGPTTRPYWQWIAAAAERFPICWKDQIIRAQTLHTLATRSGSLEGLAGNLLETDSDCQNFLNKLAAAIDGASETVCMEYYIFAAPGEGENVLSALERAVRRGVNCRVLVDSVGSKDFLKSERCKQARNNGVQIVEALPAGVVRALFARQDVRLHRKIVVIDMKVAYTGSMNMVDPKFFKQDANVGQWVDVLVKVEGPAVMSLAAVFLVDWELETGERIDLQALEDKFAVAGDAPVQVVPSGPGLRPELIHRLLLTTIYNAREELILTTPYFVPDESLHNALCTAAAKGVKVTIITPSQCDSFMARYASRARFEDLLIAGVKIYLFDGGLLHSKAISVDRQYCLIGSVNFDMRSVWINHEVTLLVYDKDYTENLLYLMQQYRAASHELTLEEWVRRPWRRRVLENILRLTGPLL